METSWSINAGYQATINTLAHVHGIDIDQLTLDGDPGPATEAAYQKIADELGLDPAATLEEQMAQIRDLAKTPEVQAEVQSALESGNIGQAQSVMAFANNDPTLEADGLNGPQTNAALEKYNQSIIESAPDVMTASPQMGSFQTLPSTPPALQERIDAVVADGGNPVIEGLQTPEQRDNLIDVAQTASEDTTRLEAEEAQLTEEMGDDFENFDTVTSAIETGAVEINEGTPEYLVNLQTLHEDITTAEGALDSYVMSPYEWNIDNGVVGMTGAPYPPRVQQLENGIMEAQNAYMQDYNDMTPEQQAEAVDHIQGQPSEVVTPDTNEATPQNEPAAVVSENNSTVGTEIPGYAPGEHPFAGDVANSEINVSTAEHCNSLQTAFSKFTGLGNCATQEVSNTTQAPAAEVARDVGSPMTLGG